jgi:5-methylcytosine-specific restriction endonuclease McrA
VSRSSAPLGADGKIQFLYWRFVLAKIQNSLLNMVKGLPGWAGAIEQDTAALTLPGGAQAMQEDTETLALLLMRAFEVASAPLEVQRQPRGGGFGARTGEEGLGAKQQAPPGEPRPSRVAEQRRPVFAMQAAGACERKRPHEVADDREAGKEGERARQLKIARLPSGRLSSAGAFSSSSSVSSDSKDSSSGKQMTVKSAEIAKVKSANGAGKSPAYTCQYCGRSFDKKNGGMVKHINACAQLHASESKLTELDDSEADDKGPNLPEHHRPIRAVEPGLEGKLQEGKEEGAQRAGKTGEAPARQLRPHSMKAAFDVENTPRDKSLRNREDPSISQAAGSGAPDAAMSSTPRSFFSLPGSLLRTGAGTGRGGAFGRGGLNTRALPASALSKAAPALAAFPHGLLDEFTPQKVFGRAGAVEEMETVFEALLMHPERGKMDPRKAEATKQDLDSPAYTCQYCGRSFDKKNGGMVKHINACAQLHASESKLTELDDSEADDKGPNLPEHHRPIRAVEPGLEGKLQEGKEEGAQRAGKTGEAPARQLRPHSMMHALPPRAAFDVENTPCDKSLQNREEDPSIAQAAGSGANAEAATPATEEKTRAQSARPKPAKLRHVSFCEHATEIIFTPLPGWDDSEEGEEQDTEMMSLEATSLHHGDRSSLGKGRGLAVFDFEEKEDSSFCHQWLSGASFAGTHSLSQQQGCSFELQPSPGPFSPGEWLYEEFKKIGTQGEEEMQVDGASVNSNDALPKHAFACAEAPANLKEADWEEGEGEGWGGSGGSALTEMKKTDPRVAGPLAQHAVPAEFEQKNDAGAHAMADGPHSLIDAAMAHSVKSVNGPSFAACGQHIAQDMSTPASDTPQLLDRAKTKDNAPRMPSSTCSPAPPLALHAAAKDKKVAETQELAVKLGALAPSAPQKEEAPREDDSSNDSFSKGAEDWLYAEIEKVAANIRSDDSSIGQAEQSCLPSGTLSRVEDLQPAGDLAVDKPTQCSPTGEDFISPGDNITAENDRSLAGAGVKTTNTLKELHTNTGGAPPPLPGRVVQDATSLPPKSSLNGITVVNSGAATSLPPTSSLNGITVVNSGASGGQYPRDSADGGREGQGWGRNNQSARGVGDMGKTAEPDCTSSGRKRKRADVQKEEKKKEKEEEKDEEKEKEKKLMERDTQNDSLSFSSPSPSSTATFPCLSSSESSVSSSSPPKADFSAAERGMGAEALVDKDKDEDQEMQEEHDDMQELHKARHDAEISGLGCCSSVPAQAKAVVTDEEVQDQSVAGEPNGHGRVGCVQQLSGEGPSSTNAHSVVMSAPEQGTLLEQEANVSSGAKSPIKNVADSKNDQGSCGHVDAQDLSAALIGAPLHSQLDEPNLR